MSAPALRVISLGWGVQSWALAAMSALGVVLAAHDHHSQVKPASA